MSVVAGLDCDYGVFLAADKQDTTEDGNTFPVQKLLSVELSNHHLAALGGVGDDAALVKSAMQKVAQELAKNLADSATGLMALVDSTRKQFVQSIRSQGRRIRRDLDDPDFLLAATIGNETMLCQFSLCTPAKRVFLFEAIGHGKHVAGYLMQKLWREALTQDQTTRLISYSIDQARKRSSLCGCGTDLWLISASGISKIADTKRRGYRDSFKDADCNWRNAILHRDANQSEDTTESDDLSDNA